MDHPWKVTGLNHLASIVVSLCRQFSPAWAVMFRGPGDLSGRLLIAWVRPFLCIFRINEDRMVL